MASRREKEDNAARAITKLMRGIVDSCDCKRGDAACATSMAKVNMAINIAATGKPMDKAMETAEAQIGATIGAPLRQPAQLSRIERIAVSRATLRIAFEKQSRNTGGSQKLEKYISAIESLGKTEPLSTSVHDFLCKVIEPENDSKLMSNIKNVLGNTTSSSASSAYPVWTTMSKPDIYGTLDGGVASAHALNVGVASAYALDTGTAASAVLPTMSSMDAVIHMYQHGWASVA